MFQLDSVSLKEIEESGLKSLLDEAYSYKSPKDRVGKSVLFQVSSQISFKIFWKLNVPVGYIKRNFWQMVEK